jgi:hypothetical protein
MLLDCWISELDLMAGYDDDELLELELELECYF